MKSALALMTLGVAALPAAAIAQTSVTIAETAPVVTLNVTESVEAAPDIATVGDLMAWLRARGENYEYAFENARTIRAALDRKHVKHDALIAGAREIAFFPPMTGG